MRALACLIVALLFPFGVSAELDRLAYNKFWSTVARVRVTTNEGQSSMGSAVVVSPGKLATNCHVTRGARTIDVLAWGSEWRVKKELQDIDHDVCVLIVERDIGQVAELADPKDLRVGHEVAAVGYPGGQRLQVAPGQIRGLYSHDGARVIRSSAPFALGQSGGGLFDREGRLVGLITFKGRAEDDFYFAVPNSWIKALLEAETADLKPLKPTEAFWEHQPGEQPYFLRAVALEMKQHWGPLQELAQEWVQHESINPESWIALGKAFHHMHRSPDAVTALRKAVDLDPQHREGWFYLGTVYRDTRESQGLDEVTAVLSNLDPEAAKALRGSLP
jgi:serine protease Do